MLRVAALLGIFLLALNNPAWAQKLYDDERSSEGWAWKQIRNDQIADFGTRCGNLDPRINVGWSDPCRQISPQFLVDVLTVPEWRDQLGRHRVLLRGVRIDGMLNLSDAEINSEVWIDASRIEGDLILIDTHWNRPLSIRGSNLAGKFLAQRMLTESSIALTHAAIETEVDLKWAKVDGALDIKSATLGGAFDAQGLTVKGILAMDDATFLGDVNLFAANIGIDLTMRKSWFAEAIRGDGLRVGGDLVIREDATFKGAVNLSRASIGRSVDIDNSSFFGELNGNGMSVEGALLMRNHAIFHSDVNLLAAHVGDSVEIINSAYDGTLIAESLIVDRSLLIFDTFASRVDLILSKIGGLAWLQQTVATSINLAGATVGEIRLGSLGWQCPSAKPLNGTSVSKPEAAITAAPLHWRLGDPAWRDARCEGADPETSRMFSLRNTFANAFQDHADAWPPSVDLEGFHYQRLGSFGPSAGANMSQRSPKAWIDWIERDRSTSTQPYTQLAAVLLAAGHRDTAAAIQFAGRERERGSALMNGDRGSWLWLTFLSAVAGYGIGSYTFRVLWWVVLFTAIGAVVLWYSPNARARWCPPNARRRGVLCLIAASLDRLLPIVRLSKEFEEFFANPPANPRNLERWQVTYFAVHAMIGWVLGLILLAAMAGVTQKG